MKNTVPTIIVDRGRVIIGRDEVAYVGNGVKPEVVEYVLSQEERRAKLQQEMKQAKQSGDTEARKRCMKEWQSMGIEVTEKATKLQNQ